MLELFLWLRTGGKSLISSSFMLSFSMLIINLYGISKSLLLYFVMVTLKDHLHKESSARTTKVASFIYFLGVHICDGARSSLERSGYVQKID